MLADSEELVSQLRASRQQLREALDRARDWDAAYDLRHPPDPYEQALARGRQKERFKLIRGGLANA
jgi:hypothetical protein